MTSGYHESRLAHDARRDTVWRALWRFHFSKQIAPEDCVLDLGCGYGEFVNNVTARRRIGLDQWPGAAGHLAPGVESVTGPVTDLSMLADDSIDYAFASNLFEHISQADLAQVLAQLHTKLTAKGTLTLVQPNYRYAYAEYFDDYTHLSVYSHVSMADFLRANSYEVIELQPRFLPLTVKSRLPVSPALVALYLALPFKPLGKQMLIRARPRR